MATFTLPDVINGGGRQIDASSLDDAKAKAQAAGWWNPGAGTFGIDSLPPDQRAAAHGGAAPPPPLYTLPVSSPQFLPQSNPASNPFVQIQAQAQSGAIASGPGGSYLIPIANLVAQGLSIADAAQRVAAAGINGIAQGAGISSPNTGNQVAARTAPATLAPADTINIGGQNVPILAVAALGIGALLLFRKR